MTFGMTRFGGRIEKDERNKNKNIIMKKKKKKKQIKNDHNINTKI